MPTRRSFLGAGARLTGAGLLAGCGVRWPPPGRGGGAVLSGRPGPTRAQPGPLAYPGTHPLGLARTRDPLLHVPPGLPPRRPPPLVVSLHGAGGDAAAGLGLLRPLADERGLLLLAPASHGPTWDAIGGDFGPDAALLDLALEKVFSLVPVDDSRVAIAGFSDGASYALGLGLANGKLFGRVVAFSPGLVPIAPRTGKPAVFVAHGDEDEVLPIGETSRQIVPALREEGYRVTYRVFSGGHAVPSEVAREAVDWLG